MKRALILLFLACSGSVAQVKTIPNTWFADTRTFINNNFSWLNTNKADIGHKHDAAYSPLSHVHLISHISGLQSILDGKAPKTNPIFSGPLTLSGTVLRGGGAALPGTCVIGDQYFLTTGTTGNYQCTATNTWTLPGGGGGGGGTAITVPSVAVAPADTSTTIPYGLTIGDASIAYPNCITNTGQGVLWDHYVGSTTQMVVYYSPNAGFTGKCGVILGGSPGATGATGPQGPAGAGVGTDNGTTVTFPAGRTITVGNTVIDDANGITTPKIVGPAGTPLEFGGACMAAASVTTPVAGEYSYFLDSGSSCALTRMDSSRITTPVGSGLGSSGYVSVPSTADASGSLGQWSRDGSYGYFHDGTRWQRWSAAYDASWLPLASIPSFSPVAGTYSGTQSVVISSSTTGSTVCYTTDGSTPAATTPGTCSTGSTYSVPVSVAATSTLKAIASKASYTNSSVGIAAYTISGGGSTLFTDTFSGSGALNASNWDNVPSLATGAGTIVQASGVAQTSAGYKAAGAVVKGITFPRNQFFQATVAAVGGSGNGIGIMLLADTAGNGYEAKVSPTGVVSMFKLTTGSPASIGITGTCGGVTATDVIKFASDSSGNLTFYRNGVSNCVLSAPDTTYTAGVPGMFINSGNTSSATLDQFSNASAGSN